MRDANLQVYEKTLSHILFHLFCLHFLRTHHDYFFGRGFESVRAQFLSGNISEKYVTCNFSVPLRFIQVKLPSCWIWHLTLSWVRFLSNKLEFVAIPWLQEHFSVCSVCVFWYVLFYKKLIVLSINQSNIYFPDNQTWKLQFFIKNYKLWYNFI